LQRGSVTHVPLQYLFDLAALKATMDLDGDDYRSRCEDINGTFYDVCVCWFALASGYDWISLGGERNITWTVIANKSRVEKQKKFCTN
jgi:hypothetical protein